MTESTRTTAFVAAAVVSLGLAWVSRPASTAHKALNDSGTPFFDSFDPLTATSLDITSYNEATGRLMPFKVAQQSGRWSIPSHDNYPADAKDHLAEAATSVMSLRKGPMVSDRKGDHELYGVGDPRAGKVDAGAGTRVTLQDSGGKTLVDLIIGKAVKDSPDLHYVRVPDKDRVYSVKVNTQSLTTKFEDWIERDLLKLNPSQIREVIVEDYSVDELDQNNPIKQRDRMVLHYTSETPPPPEGQTPSSPAPSQWSLEGLGAHETLQAQRLDDMRNALGDLRIIDVHRKPAGLSSQLQQTGGLKLDADSVTSLATRGYYLVQAPNGYKLLSNEGEIAVRTNEGVEYTLRFGEVEPIDVGGDLSQSDSQGGVQNGRFLFVTASFNQNMIEQPVYDPVPETPATQASQPASQPADPARDAIVKSNDAKRQAYEQKIKQGQDRVKELNGRFADWYYLVSDSVYQKLRFKRADIVTAQGSPPTPASTGQNSPPESSHQ
jgi:hypothetical protein